MKAKIILLVIIIFQVVIFASCDYRFKETNSSTITLIPVNKIETNSSTITVVPINKIETNSPTITVIPGNKNETESIKSYYKIIKDKKGYIVKFYNKNKKVVYEMDSPKEPYIVVIDKNILQTGISLGSPNNYEFFFNTKTSEISDTYNNPILIKNGKVVIFQNDKLIVSDLFNKSKYYREFVRDFSKTAVPSNSILSADFTNTKSLSISYLKGKDMVETQEVIELN